MFWAINNKEKKNDVFGNDVIGLVLDGDLPLDLCAAKRRADRADFDHCDPKHYGLVGITEAGHRLSWSAPQSD